MHRIGLFAVVVLTALTAPGCAESSATPIRPAPNAIYLLGVEPQDSVDILDARENAKDDEPIVVAGRIEAEVNPWVEGRAAFLLVDTRVLPCCEPDQDGKASCSNCAQEMLAASTMVKFVGPDGKPLPVDAQSLLGIKAQDTVVVQGVSKRDSSNNLTIEAVGVFVRKQ